MNIAIIGAGEGGTNLLKALHNLENISVQLVVDKQCNASGMQLAKDLRIPCSDSIKELNHYHIDVIIEVTGVPAVMNELNELFGQSHIIVSAEVAHLMMSIVNEHIKTTDQVNHQIEVIQQTVNTLKDELDSVSKSVTVLQDVNRMLVESTEKSNTYISKSDEIISAVNNISQKIKILGLNANIESARAGEFGRGFSVVAKEVEKLSDSTSQFASEISTLLQSIADENKNISSEVQQLDQLSNDQQSLSTSLDQAITVLIKQTNH